MVRYLWVLPELLRLAQRLLIKTRYASAVKELIAACKATLVILYRNRNRQ